MSTLLLSQGVPMIAHGDEIGRTQGGNNNAYCQDNEITWMDWELTETQADLLEFTRRLVELRRENPVFRRRRFFAGSPDHGGESDVHDISWFTTAGTEMADDDWRNGYAKSVMVFLNGRAIPEPDRRGQRIVGDSFLLIFNGHYEPLDFTLPSRQYGSSWRVEIDTAAESVSRRVRRAGTTGRAEARSLVVLRGLVDRGLTPPRGSAYSPLTRTIPS